MKHGNKKDWRKYDATIGGRGRSYCHHIMQYTSSLNLKKPEGTDVVDINVLNENTDIIDMEITKKATQTLDGRMSKEDKKKLDGVEEGANNYTHPSKHAANLVTIADTGNNFSSTNVEGALSELFQSASNGKEQIATAITGMGGRGRS